MTLYLTSPDGTILDRYRVPRFVGFPLAAIARIRRGWRAFRSEPHLGKIEIAGPVAVSSTADEVVSALVNLGMRKREALCAVKNLRAGDFDQMLREALAGRAA